MGKRAFLSSAPTWVDDFKAGKLPAPGTPAWHAFLAWAYFGDDVAGLPREGTKAAHVLLVQAARAERDRTDD